MSAEACAPCEAAEDQSDLRDLLRFLAADYFVELETTMSGWRLILTRRSGGYYAEVYQGEDPEEIARRALRGDAPDSRSR